MVSVYLGVVVGLLGISFFFLGLGVCCRYGNYAGIVFLFTEVRRSGFCVVDGDFVCDLV